MEFTYVAEAVDITHRSGAERIGLMGKDNQVFRWPGQAEENLARYRLQNEEDGQKTGQASPK